MLKIVKILLKIFSQSIYLVEQDNNGGEDDDAKEDAQKVPPPAGLGHNKRRVGEGFCFNLIKNRFCYKKIKINSQNTIYPKLIILIRLLNIEDRIKANGSKGLDGDVVHVGKFLHKGGIPQP